MDRYAALGFAAAHLTLQRAGVAPEGTADAAWGLALGSSTGCWSSNASFHRDLLRLPAPELSPAVFARTVANSVNGEVSIAQRIGGPSETFVSGTTAGAEAIAEAGAWIAEGKARFVLAGGLEAPDEAVEALRAERNGGAAPETLAEAAGLVLLAADGTGSNARHLRAYAQLRDPRAALPLASVLDAVGLREPAVTVCGAVPDALRERWCLEAPAMQLEFRGDELGAAAIVFALEQARAATLILIARDAGGSTVVLAFGP
jgi:hypothetical protein